MIEPGKLADMLILDADPLADISVLRGGKHLSAVIKGGRQVDLYPQLDGEPALALK